ncbi:odorant receptor 137-3 [Megalops cyprinoides]|uniref:odorant receptor 137-3 n=1 Tax=Megalops cyprinoides TaxID=118141 RepID=UPI001864C8C4|nr:odorant receptor 137-3 [Megalops cyprinoides]
MNSTHDRLDQFQEAFVKNFILVLLGVIINYINGTFVFAFFNSQIFYNDPRYILYIHMVINDMIMLSLSVTLHVVSYIWPFLNVSVCCVLLIIADATHKNTPLNLASMAIERYIAVCNPLRHAQICTVRRTYVLIGIIWGVGAMPGLTDLVIMLAVNPPSLFSSALLCFSLNIYNTQYHKEKSTVLQSLYISFVWITLIYTYFRVLFAAKAATTDPVSARKAQNTILLHGVQVLLSMMSYITPLVDRVLLQLFPQERTKIMFVSFLFSNILPRLLSPLIYGVRDQKLAKHVRGYLLCKVSVRKVKPVHTWSTHSSE